MSKCASLGSMPAPVMGDDTTALCRVFFRVDCAASAAETLDLPPNATITDVRKAYRSLALQLHPDKASRPDLIPTHQRLFLKIQAAQDFLLERLENGEEVEAVVNPKALEDTPYTLHARIWDHKEAMKAARQYATDRKNEREWKEELKRTRQNAVYLAGNKGKLTQKTFNDAVEQILEVRKDILPKKFKKEECEARKVRIAAYEAKEKAKNLALDQVHAMQRKRDGIVACTKEDIKIREDKAMLTGTPDCVAPSYLDHIKNNARAKELHREVLEERELEKRMKLAIKAAERGQGLFGYSSVKRSRIAQKVRKQVGMEMDKLFCPNYQDELEWMYDELEMPSLLAIEAGEDEGKWFVEGEEIDTDKEVDNEMLYDEIREAMMEK